MIATIKGTQIEGTPEEVYKLLQMMNEKDKREKEPFMPNPFETLIKPYGEVTWIETDPIWVVNPYGTQL